ncbi:3-isopropylmalate dehydratase large subunit [Ignisphaera sp. 4213-co]|uniref:3-isopropylmalate dehydratase large subunit n=1 Tax=Ignisphaera cupida TaxID=3050454 RepID=A0ABD4Z747_9CREN|nr:3-isopropylmalate dehydratase large subunit [Ignisphaera sp. 4213-co]MDK6029167.1 3-isopropylmalate dehydratase large subunit [Ignisphaera sp. 4213-co]
MGKTLTEKILERASGRSVSPRDVVEVAVDIVAFHDLTGYHVIEVLEKLGETRIHNLDSLVIAFDHLVPPPDVRSAEIQQNIRLFAKRYNIKNFHDAGFGILHQVLIEKYVLPGQVVMAADSHTTTSGALGAFAQGLGASDIAAIVLTGKTWLTVPQPFKIRLVGSPREWITGKEVALEILRVFKSDYFNGMSIEVFVDNPNSFPMDYRVTVANMGIEMNADTLMFIPDSVTVDYIRSERGFEPKIVTPDPDAKYVDEYTIELDKVDFLVSAPHSVDNVKSVRDVWGTEVDYVFIGSCTNGRLSDFEIAAKIMKGKKAKTRCIAIPASWNVFRKALNLGYIQTLVEAGCIVTYGTCGPCIGGHFGIAAPNEVVLSTSNRNFVGRMGSPQAKIYLSGPAIAAAAAVSGKIVEPGDVM